MSASDLRPVQISASIHAALKALSAAGGKHVTIKSLIEDAVVAQYPSARSSAEADHADALAEARAQLFDRIVATIYGSLNPLEVNLALDALEGDVEGSAGQQIRVRDLAYHLRSAETDIGSMSDLVRDYEQGGRSR